VFLLSCSATSDPTGTWRTYALDAMVDGATKTKNWADFPGLGVDSHAIYITANMFAFDGNFQYAKIRVVAKAGPYSGGAAPFFDFTKMKNSDGSFAFTIQPCHTFGAPQVEYLANSAFPSGKTITLWQVAKPTTGPTLTRSTVAVSNYSLPPNADQKGGGTPLHSGDVRTLHAVFRGGSVWLVLTTSANWGGTNNKASIHWVQIDPATPRLVQEGIYGHQNFHYYYPALCPDNNGNLILVFSRSGPSEFASIRFTGRLATDSLGSLQGSAQLKAGAANYLHLDGGGRNRWGDYSGIAADPANPRLIWFYSLYPLPSNQWDTWTGSAFF
jgi:hypothetical protein